jgi:eukaryotic-like serine/threonine-protein kinase
MTVVIKLTTSQRGFAVPLFLKIFLAITTVVALALLAAILVTKQQGDLAAKQQTDRDLKQILAAHQSVEGSDFSRIEDKTTFISADPNVAQYFNQASTDELGLSDTGNAEGAASILDLLDERMNTLGVDVGLLMDANGRVLARAPKAEEQLEEVLAEDPLVSRVIKDPEGLGISGYWRDGGRIFEAAVQPIGVNDLLVGYVLLGTEVTQETAARIAKISAADVALFGNTGKSMNLIGSSFSGPAKSSLEKIIGDASAPISQTMMAGDKRFEVQIDNRNYAGETRLLKGKDGQTIGAVTALAQTAQAQATFATIQRAVNWTGVAALLAALLASWFLARALIKPIRSLAGVAEKAALGDYNLHVDAKGSDEIGTLGRAFDSLLTSLREKGDMEGFVSSLSKHIPESVGSGASVHLTPAKDAKRYHLTMLGIELRRINAPVNEGDEQNRLAELSEHHVLIRELSRTYDGLMLEQAGTRLVLGFGGEQRQRRALTVLSDLLNRGESMSGLIATIHDGEVIFGSLPSLDPYHAAVGAGIVQLHRLLVEATPGHTILGPQFAKSLLPLLGHEPTTTVGAASGKKFYALTANDLQSIPKATGMTQMAPLPGAEDQPLDPNATRIISPQAAATPRSNFAANLLPGTRLGGRFEIQSVLGSGGMGVVYKAQDLKLDDVVALKMLKGAALMDLEHLERLKSELKLARKITHPNILRTHDFGEFNGQPFISMEYVRGMTLRYLLEQSGRLPYFAALRIARQITSGLQAAHEVGVLHRDIKPENVLIEASGNSKLMDFGIARPIRRTVQGPTQPGMFVGTPTYCAPEALAGEDVDARSDIYSLGVMFSELFCGSLPYDAKGTMELYVAHSQQAPIAPSTLWPEVPKPLEAIILKCLEKQANSRFVSAEELGGALAMLKA